MGKRILLAAVCSALWAGSALAAEPERVVVRNRLYNPAGQLELGVEAGMSLINKLVSHDNLQVTAAYNFSNTWAVELFAGYALSSHTDIANQVNANIASKPATSTGFSTVDDFAGLWQMQWNVTADARWAPIYGKFNLVADVPVHFQAYIALGGGVAGLERKSVTYCLSPATTDINGSPVCAQDATHQGPLDESRISPVIQFGGGMRFWLGPKVILRLEVRDYTFPDKYQVGINRSLAQTGDTEAGTPASSPGFQHLVFLSVGLSYAFF